MRTFRFSLQALPIVQVDGASFLQVQEKGLRVFYPVTEAKGKTDRKGRPIVTVRVDEKGRRLRLPEGSRILVW